MHLHISENADPNYLAVVVKCPEIKPHPNADRLSIVNIFGNDVIVGKGQYTMGEPLVYFPVESCIKPEFLSWANLLDRPELNADEKTKGFFSPKGCRVKAVKLREIPSQGFLYPVFKLKEYYNVSENIFRDGTSFDTVGDHHLVTKYVRNDKKPQEQVFKKSKIPNWINNTMGILPRPIRKALFPPIKWYYGLSADNGIKSQIIDGQFKFHYKTEQLGRNIWILNPNDHITITSKLHGTSAIFGNILCKKKLTLLQSVGKKLLNLNIPETEYKMVYSSRSVLKNRQDGKYTEDVWGQHAEKLQGIIPEGITIFGEIVGYSSPAKCIQKNYDYGNTLGENELRVYRVTNTDINGVVTEYSWSEIETLCHYLKLDTVPKYYEGLAQDLFPDIILDEQWCNNWLAKLKDVYLDKTCELCKSGAVNEGIVVKINSRDSKPVFKFKSPKFVLKESSDRDTGEVDMEEDS
jgi:hypothetical protein